MKSVWPLFAALFLSAVANRPVFSASGYQFTTFAVAGAVATLPTAINNSGQVVGFYTTSYFNCCYDYQYTWRGFLFRNGTYVTINVPGATWTKPLSINDSGEVYGSFYAPTPNGQQQQVFRYDIATGRFTTIPLNTDGIIQPAGYSISAIGPSGSIVLGSSEFNGGFIYSNGRMMIPAPPLAGGGRSTVNPLAVNAAGEIVGTYSVYDTAVWGGVSHYASAPFKYFAGAYSPLDTKFTPVAIGPSSEILGSYLASDQLKHAAIYRNGTIALFDAPDAAPNTATFPMTFLQAINSSGQIAGEYSKPSGNQAFIATPIAAPSGEKARAYVDFIDKGAISGTYQMDGWAIDSSSPIVAISISVDGSFVGNANYGKSRTDVCAAYPNQVACPNVGWTFPLDTTIIADGTHTLQAVAVSADGIHASAAASFTVRNPAVPAQNPMQMSIDVPWPNSTLSGNVNFAGWAFDPNSSVRQVQVVVDASVTAYPYNFKPVASYGSARPDVCGVFLNAKNCLTSGWMFSLNTANLGNGPHTLTVIAQAFDGTQRSITTAFTISNTSSVKAYIDQPSANAGPLSGSALVSGWALDVGLRIGAIQLIIDGSPYYGSGFPNYVTIGGYRPDVCLVYPSSPDCPKVGWTMLLDTTQFADGRHTVAVSANSQGKNFTLNSTITSPVAFDVKNASSTSKAKVYIDQPASQAQVYWGYSTFSGWAIDDAVQIRSIQVFLDGTPSGSANGFQWRPDVCAVYPDRPGCPFVGWTYSFDTTLLTNGVHTVTVTELSGTGAQASVSQNFTVQNANGASSTRVYIDMPGSQANVVAGQIAASGWAFDETNTISNMLVQVDGQPLGLTTPTLNRKDVCDMFPSAAGCPMVGWAMPIDTTLLANGVHKLSIAATLYGAASSGSASATASTFFTVANSPDKSPVRLYIDTPNGSAAQISGVTSFAGWALDSNAIISSVAISVDGGVPSAATYGVSRQDVCAAFPNNIGCPAADVGWAFVIDSTLLANGPHTVNVTATASDGLHKTVSAPFTVLN